MPNPMTDAAVVDQLRLCSYLRNLTGRSRHRRRRSDVLKKQASIVR